MLNYKFHVTLIFTILLFGLYFLSKKNNYIKKVFLGLTILFSLVYLLWRTLYTLPISSGTISMILGITLLLAEVIGFFQSLVLKLLFIKPNINFKADIKLFEQLPTVDVFIVTYNETTSILEKTVAACLNINYPKELINIYVCDDGRRNEVVKLCEAFGVKYLTRDDNKHAKAGNLNNALRNSSGDFILILDADMVPKPNILERTMGYFKDDKVGFVQTPQVFYNSDPFQHNLRFGDRIPNEQDFFMRDIQEGRAKFNAVLHVGTNAVFRRKAINEIGGIPVGTITEDMATGMLIQAKGYKTIFVNDVLATGLSVESYTDLIKQRERWCRGNIQVSKSLNPIRMKGLTLMQKLIYIDGFVYWFFGIQKLIYIIYPLIFLIYRIPILNAQLYDLLLFWLPYFLSSVLIFKSLNFRKRSLTWSHIYEIAMAPYIAFAALVELIFSKPIPFNVTPKGIKNKKINFAFIPALPHFFLFALTFIGWNSVIPVLKSSDINMVESITINFLWSIYNFIGIVVSILVCFEQPRERVSERITIKSNVRIKIAQDQEAICVIKDISETGLQVECTNIKDYEAIRGIIDLSFDGLENIQGKILRSKKEDGKITYGIAFKEFNRKQYLNLIKFITQYDEGYF